MLERSVVETENQAILPILERLRVFYFFIFCSLFISQELISYCWSANDVFQNLQGELEQGMCLLE